MQLGKYGIWWSGSWSTPDATVEEIASEMERLGYSTLWMSGGFSPGIPKVFAKLLAGTVEATIATGILSVWVNEPSTAATEVAGLGDRFLLGIGASHAPLVEALGNEYTRPYSKVASWLDELDASEPTVPSHQRMLAALGPRMMHLAGERSLGAHPYFVTDEHTARARELLGHASVLAPEVAVVLDADPATARATARSYTTGYLGLANYANNLLTLGFRESDLQDGGSDRLVDAVVPWGTPEVVAGRLAAHHDAGADHVCIQVIAPRSGHFPLEEYRELAAVLA